MEASAGFNRLAEGPPLGLEAGWPSLGRSGDGSSAVLDGRGVISAPPPGARRRPPSFRLHPHGGIAPSGTAILYEPSRPSSTTSQEAGRSLRLRGLSVTPCTGASGGERTPSKNPGGPAHHPRIAGILLMSSPPGARPSPAGGRISWASSAPLLGTERDASSSPSGGEFLIGRTVPQSPSAPLREWRRPRRPSGRKTLPCRILVWRKSANFCSRSGDTGRPGRKGGAAGPPRRTDSGRLPPAQGHTLFTNSRSRTEELAAALSAYLRPQFRPQQFPHHGSLARPPPESRSEEGPSYYGGVPPPRAGHRHRPVASIGQVGVRSGLRQRSTARDGGRARHAPGSSLRRTKAGPSHPADALRLSLVQTAAILSLLLGNGGPPRRAPYHLSTLSRPSP